MKMITLTPRLHSVSELVQPGARFADIGTDHAYLPVYLIQHGVIDRAIAADLREGPLFRARATAERYGLMERMDFRLCDGLSGIEPKEVDTIAIAGMGGETIAEILKHAPWTGRGAYRLLLQPMSAQPDLRRWLVGNGYRIEREVLSREGETIYLTLLACPGNMGTLTDVESWAGQQEQGMNAPLRSLYLARLIRQTERIATGLSHSSRLEDLLRFEKIKAVHTALRDMKEEWDAWQR